MVFKAFRVLGFAGSRLCRVLESRVWGLAPRKGLGFFGFRGLGFRVP